MTEKLKKSKDGEKLKKKKEKLKKCFERCKKVKMAKNVKTVKK